MGLFDFLKKPVQTPAPPSTIPQERLWVGTIMGLIIYQLNAGEWNKAKLADWSIIIDEDSNEPFLLSAPPKSGEAKRYCRLGDCSSFANVTNFISIPLALEMAVQDLAFEICRKAEPRWNEIINSNRNA